MTEDKAVTKKFRFKWIQCSPDPHNVTMRNTLEPEDMYVLIDIPVRLLVNTESILKADLGVDIPKEELELTLTPEAMKYAIQQLSLQEAVAEESLSDDESWDDETEESLATGDDENEWSDEDDKGWDE